MSGFPRKMSLFPRKMSLFPRKKSLRFGKKLDNQFKNLKKKRLFMRFLGNNFFRLSARFFFGKLLIFCEHGTSTGFPRFFGVKKHPKTPISPSKTGWNYHKMPKIEVSRTGTSTKSRLIMRPPKVFWYLKLPYKPFLCVFIHKNGIEKCRNEDVKLSKNRLIKPFFSDFQGFFKSNLIKNAFLKPFFKWNILWNIKNFEIWKTLDFWF